MTNPERSEPTSPTYPGREDLLEDAISWFTGRSSLAESQPTAPEPFEAADPAGETGDGRPVGVVPSPPAEAAGEPAGDLPAPAAAIPVDEAAPSATPWATGEQGWPGAAAVGAGPAEAGPADAGLADPGPADIGPADAGPADSVPAASVPEPADAGPADAGPADAGPADAGLAEAGPADWVPAASVPEPAEAGPTDWVPEPADAGPAEAGPAEAGPTDWVPEPADAGPADAGTADAGLVGGDPDSSAEPASVGPAAADVPPPGAIDSEAVEFDQAGIERPEPAASLFRDDAAPTFTAGVAAAGATGLEAFATTRPGAERPGVIDDGDDSLRRAEEREARDRQLGKVQPLAAVPAPVPHSLPTTYRFFPSFGFLLLRLVTAAILGIRAIMHALDIAALEKLWADLTVLSPQALTVAWVQTGVEAVIAVLLVIGLGTRVAGALLAVLSVCLLVFMMWGAANPFLPGVVGFTGEIEVLLAAVGVFFLTNGGGRAAIDGTIHKARVDAKNERLVA